MIDGIPKISVLVICYNQENVISRAIDSLLAQKDYIYEICVSDDCSKDRTWDILQEYSRQYPGLFVLNRNEPNVGIFENIEKTWTMPMGDLIYSLSGDDECPIGWFSKVLEYIRSNKIDIVNDRFAVYGDYECRYPSGDSFIYSNRHVVSGLDPVRLSLRGHIGNRSAVCSKSVIECYKKVSKGKSYIAESAQDLQLPLFAKSVYYLPCVGNVYFTRIGVSANMTQEKLKDREYLYVYAMNMLLDNGYVFTKTDLAYIQFKTLKSRPYRLEPIAHRLKVILMLLRSIDITLTLRCLRIKRYWFALMIRLPHRTPLKMSL